MARVVERKVRQLTPEQLEARVQRLKARNNTDAAFTARVVEIVLAHLTDRQLERFSEIVDSGNAFDEALQRAVAKRCPWLFV